MVIDTKKLTKDKVDMYNNHLTRIENSIKGYFKYTGSVASRDCIGDLYYPRIESTYCKLEIEEMKDLEKLIDWGVVPNLYIGSRSQGLTRCATNFSLDMFLLQGISDAKSIIKFLDAGVTPFHIYFTQKSGVDMESMNEEEVIAAVKNKYKDKFVPENKVEYNNMVNLLIKYDV
jgi:hypothetical protein